VDAPEDPGDSDEEGQEASMMGIDGTEGERTTVTWEETYKRT
jgi:hypothetical protein